MVLEVNPAVPVNSVPELMRTRRPIREKSAWAIMGSVPPLTSSANYQDQAGVNMVDV